MNKAAVLVLSVVVSISAMASNNDPLPDSQNVTNSSVIVLPAIKPASWTSWASNTAFATNAYIGQFTNVVSDLGITNSQIRYWYALPGGTNSAYLLAAPLSLTTNTIDGGITWHPVPSDRKEAVICNDGTNVVYLGFNQAATSGKGIRLSVSGGEWSTGDKIENRTGTSAWQGEVRGITANGVANNVTKQEFTK